MEEDTVKVVESYIHAIRDKDLSKAPVAPDITFEDPLTRLGAGREAWQEFVGAMLPAITDARIVRHIVEGEYVATLWEAETVWGLIPIFECFHVVDGQVKDAKAFLDPRPITNAAGA